MDLVKNGESSTSPQRHPTGLPAASESEPHLSGGSNVGGTGGVTKTKLVLPQWDLFPPRPLHASQDLISLLHLDGLYHQHVLPYSDIVDDGQGDAGGKKRTRSKMEKGYQHLIPDIIDPVPLGGQKENMTLLPLLDVHDPDSRPIALLDDESFSVARLDIGTQDGYERGEKKGVKEAEAKRRRRRENRQAQSMSVPPEISSLPSPALHAWDQPTPASPGFAPPVPSHLTPRPAFSHARTASGGATRGGTPGGRGGTPHHLGKRPWDGTPGGGTPKRGRGSGFRTGSETPRGRGRPNYPQGFRSKTDY